jgi:hypothetical protein
MNLGKGLIEAGKGFMKGAFGKVKISLNNVRPKSWNNNLTFGAHYYEEKL